MKKLLMACAVFVFAATAVNAQGKEGAKIELSKEAKATMKKLKEENLNASFKDAGLSDEETKLAKSALDAAKEESNKLKENTSLTEEDKKAKKEDINQQKNAKLKEIMKDKHKIWSEIRKKQKAEEEEMAIKLAQ